MIPDPDSLGAPGEDTVGDLLAWRPAHGVLSIYIDADPRDRSPAWRTELHKRLSTLAKAEEDGSHEARTAIRATAERLQRDLLDAELVDYPRGVIGFVEVAAKPGEERWYGVRMPPRLTEVFDGPVPQVHPLLEVLDDGAALGIAVVASDRVRLFHWRLGQAEQLHNWELEYFGDDWRERKAQRPRDPTKGEAVSAAGRDQYNQRLEATRERFAEQTGELARAESKKHGWHQTLAFGDERYVRQFAHGFGPDSGLRHVNGADLISEPSARIEGRVEELLPELNREREKALIERIKEAAFAEGRSALGVQESFQALQEGRVEHLVYDTERDYTGAGLEGTEDGHLPLIERMVELALSTRAKVTPVEGESAALLSEQGGIVSLLRY